ncbi:hypothetical protein [Leptospira bandrabouensis]|uniref:Uncharacterized protein n=1 Tax=Leptospira bandrabouensis TaxID=2484903 RepID=A0A6H3NWN1_9LEPT|nr:hypothetical protein [Leptospira bandrabouensis]MCG6143619.1 hypothetical protein [Leptospira bandrabouensis]MCG6151341.1 hypothetical protein [Leptospira bandrabouensis]MCG6159279.1 hypothetical protein [Leptospira bandrabouensis]MCG6163213.1 hypothetical protein [Leptospira bandrabouensis]MCW7459972.1 hypothetical protein [Leptospira bandrabouensis]
MYPKFIRIIIILNLTSFVGCVSIPFNPTNHTEDCLAYYYQTKRQVTEVFDENVLTLGLVLTLSLIHSALSPVFLLPILTTPYIHYKNKVKADEILDQWKKERCGVGELKNQETKVRPTDL